MKEKDSAIIQNRLLKSQVATLESNLIDVYVLSVLEMTDELYNEIVLAKTN